MIRFRHVHVLAFAGSWAGTLFVLGRPLLEERAERGDYLWGLYPLKYVYVGLPLLAVALATSAVWLVRAERRPRVAARLWTMTAACFVAVALFDLTWAFGVLGAATPNAWLDRQHIARQGNEPDPELGFRRAPHASWSGAVRGVDRVVDYRADALGFRNAGPVEAPEVVFVGDSYTEAAQVALEKTFVARFGEVTGKRVLNLGRGAYGPQQELIVLRRHAFDGHTPEVVVWQLFDGNDLADAIEYADWKSGRTAPAPLLQRYLANSFFRPLLDATYRSKTGDFALLDLGGEAPLSVTLRYRWMPEQARERQAGFEATIGALREGAELCRERGARLLVVFVPIMSRVLTERISFPDPRDRERYLPEAAAGCDFGSELARCCREEGIELLDLLPVFRAAASSDPAGIYIPRDEHLDERGHEIVAEELAGWYERGRR